MSFFIYLAGIVVIAAIGFMVYDKRKTNSKLGKAIVHYSEQIGEVIIEHEKTYIGKIDYENDVLTVAALNIRRPIPPAQVFVPTKGGNKKLYLIKIDSDRMGFRIPNVSNKIYVPTKDSYGNYFKNKNGKPLLKAYKFQYCDDVIEPDVKHWNHNIMEKLRRKHQTKSDMLSKWMMPIMMGVLLVGGIVVIHMTSKHIMDSIDRQMIMAGETEKLSKENVGLINNLIQRVDQQQAGQPLPPTQPPDPNR